MSALRRGAMSQLYKDPRWVALHSGRWACPCCGEYHTGLFDLVCEHPDAWASVHKGALEAFAGLDEDSMLTPDFCVMAGQQFFLLCDIDLPVVGAPGRIFTQSVWAALGIADFKRYVDALAKGQQGQMGPMRGWLANRLKGYPDTLDIVCAIEPRPNAARPALHVTLERHPLLLEQQHGLTFERILDLYALNEHDIRSEYLRN